MYNMKTIITTMFILLTTILNAQSNWNNKSDSIDFHTGIKMLTELFDGKLIKNGKVQKNLVPIRYYWGRCCKEGTLDDYPSFEISYRSELTKELRNNLNNVEKSFKSEVDLDGDQIITIGFEGVYIDGNNSGERVSMSFEFHKKNDMMLLHTIDIPSKLSE